MKQRPVPIGGPAGAAGEVLYRAAVGIRGRLYDLGFLRPIRAAAPVVSVGNVTAGGTGKTPVAIAIVSLLLERGRKPALLSRGYGRDDPKSLIAIPPGEEPGPGAHLRWGDEPCLFRIRHPEVPIVLAPDRVRAARVATVLLGADVLVLDDGMQHRRLHRDLEIVVVHGLAPFGNRHLLPRGLLREPPAALRRADCILVQTVEGTRTDLDAELDRAGAPLLRFRFSYAPDRLSHPDGRESAAREFLTGRRVLAVSGIGRPESFERTIAECGAEIAGRIRFPDHHRFDVRDCATIREEARSLSATAVTTEKDRCRLSAEEIEGTGLHTLGVRLAMEDPERRFPSLFSRLGEEERIEQEE